MLKEIIAGEMSTAIDSEFIKPQLKRSIKRGYEPNE